MEPRADGTEVGPPMTRGGGGGQAVTGSVVLGEVIQIQHVGGNVSVTLSRPTYRVEEFPAVPAGLPVAQARAQPSRLLLARYELVPFTGRAGGARGGGVGVDLGRGGGGQPRAGAPFPPPSRRGMGGVAGLEGFAHYA